MKKYFVIIAFLLFSSTLFAQLVPYRKGDLWGLSDRKGTIVVKTQYEDVDFYFNTFIFKSKGKLGILNDSGRVIIRADYTDISFNDKYFIAQKQNQYGLFDIHGKMLLPCIYQELSIMSPVVVYKQNNKYGIIGLKSRKILIPNKYDEIRQSYQEGCVYECVSKNQITFLNKDFKVVKRETVPNDNGDFMDNVAASDSDVSYRSYSNRNQNHDDLKITISESFFFERKSGLWALVNSKNEVLADFIYEDIDLKNSTRYNADSSFFCMKKNGKWGLLLIIKEKSPLPTVYLDFQYDRISAFVKSFYLLENVGLQGAINRGMLVNTKYIECFPLFLQENYTDVSYFKVKTVTKKKGIVGVEGFEYFEE